MTHEAKIVRKIILVEDPKENPRGIKGSIDSNQNVDTDN